MSRSKRGHSSRWRRASRLHDVPGAIAIILVLLIFPIVAIMGSATVAVVLGFVLNRDGEQRNVGSELLDTNY